jgi:glycosyltransferase involved in cell wall biosynthesis
VGVNRRLAHELQRTGSWDVTVVGPSTFRGDFAWHTLRPEPDERCSVEAVPVRLGRQIHVMTYGRRLRRLLRQPWDLVHCWEEPYVASAAQIAAWTPARVPLVIATFQNIDKTYPPPFSWFERYTFGRADALIAFGRTVLDVAVAHGFPASRSRVIPPGVDTARFAPDAAARTRGRASLGWHDAVPVVGFVGRFVTQKGVRLLVEVLDRLRLPWRALFVGSGPLEPELRSWASGRGGRVAIVQASHDEVPAWLNAMDVLCAPSQTTRVWQEQFGRMLIEAFAVGIPVVAARSGEIPHVVGDAGMLVPENDRDGWARALTSLLSDPHVRARFAARGRARAVSRYDWSVVAAEHDAFFSQIIEGRPAVLEAPTRMTEAHV